MGDSRSLAVANSFDFKSCDPDTLLKRIDTLEHELRFKAHTDGEVCRLREQLSRQQHINYQFKSSLNNLKKTLKGSENALKDMNGKCTASDAKISAMENRELKLYEALDRANQRSMHGHQRLKYIHGILTLVKTSEDLAYANSLVKELIDSFGDCILDSKMGGLSVQNDCRNSQLTNCASQNDVSLPVHNVASLRRVSQLSPGTSLASGATQSQNPVASRKILTPGKNGGRRNWTDSIGPGNRTDSIGPGNRTDSIGPGNRTDSIGPGNTVVDEFKLAFYDIVKERNLPSPNSVDYKEAVDAMRAERRGVSGGKLITPGFGIHQLAQMTVHIWAHMLRIRNVHSSPNQAGVMCPATEDSDNDKLLNETENDENGFSLWKPVESKCLILQMAGDIPFECQNYCPECNIQYMGSEALFQDNILRCPHDNCFYSAHDRCFRGLVLRKSANFCPSCARPVMDIL